MEISFFFFFFLLYFFGSRFCFQDQSKFMSVVSQESAFDRIKK